MALEEQNFSVPDIYIPIDELEKEVEPIIKPEYCIYKVPEMLSKGNKDAYTPHLISIGPMHYNNPKLKPMEEQKKLHLYFFRKKRVTDDEVLKHFEKSLEHNEDKIRRRYSEKVFPKKDEFVRMILLDAVFIMELFLRKQEKDDSEKDEENEDDSGKAQEKHDYICSKSCFCGKAKEEDDSKKDEEKDDGGKAKEKDGYILDNPWLRNEIERDLLLAENQLPFFVLEELYTHLKKQDQSFVELARNFFEFYNPGPVKSAKNIKQKNLLRKDWDKPEHFTDLIRSFYITNDLKCEKNLDEYLNVKDATKLRNAGITFKPKSTDDIKCLLDVKFEKGEFLNWLPFLSCLPHLDIVKAHLQIPKLEVDDSTEYVLRNLMAFEQCHYPWGNYICSYAYLIDMLIGQENDAAVLLEQGIITNDLSSEKELTTMINNLCKNIVINTHCFGDIPEKLNKHYKNPWNKTLAELRLVYFSNLWKGTGTVVAIVVLVISIFNFIRSNIEYF